jgi:hypothetical protein
MREGEAMGEIVGAGLVSHVPTIMLPAQERLQLNGGRESSLVVGLRRLRAEVLDRLAPDTIVVLDTHWEVTFEHVVTAHERRRGVFTSHPRADGPRDGRGPREKGTTVEVQPMQQAGETDPGYELSDLSSAPTSAPTTATAE